MCLTQSTHITVPLQGLKTLTRPGHALRTGLSWGIYLHNSLSKMYWEKGHMGVTCEVFAQMPHETVKHPDYCVCQEGIKHGSPRAILQDWSFWSWGLMSLQWWVYALLKLWRMGDTKLGKSVHGWTCENLILDKDITDMYTKCKELALAPRVFDGLYERNTVL